MIRKNLLKCREETSSVQMTFTAAKLFRWSSHRVFCFFFNNTKIWVLKGVTYILNGGSQQSLIMQEVTAACTGRSISLTQCYSCMFWDILHKETRAVKLVFLQRVKEVTTDGADAARQPTDIQYWFIAFFARDKGTTGPAAVVRWRMAPVWAADLNISLHHEPERRTQLVLLLQEKQPDTKT